MKQLRVKQKVHSQLPKTDELEKCITGILKNIKDIDRWSKWRYQCRNSEVIYDDYDYTPQSSGKTISYPNVLTQKGVSVNKLGLNNIFHQGCDKLIEMNIPSVRIFLH